MPARDLFIDGQWQEGRGDAFASTDPATGEHVLSGRAATAAQVNDAVAAARRAFPNWSSLPAPARAAFAQTFARQLAQHRDRIVLAICREVGKPRWEALTEVQAMESKVSNAIEALSERNPQVSSNLPGGRGWTRYKPHGVAAVLGPFNLPGHLPGAHIIPALLAGNTIVFKPSELTPEVGRLIAELWNLAGLPPGVLNLVQGSASTGQALSAHDDIDALFFTGSYATGLALSRSFAGRPEKILALEMGGNAPLIVWDVADLDAAAYLTIQSAYVTAGQRCTCARRLIIPEGPPGTAFQSRLLDWIKKIHVGAYTEDPEPFHGPVISARAAGQVMEAQKNLRAAGGISIAAMKAIGSSPAMLTPGLMDVTQVKDRPDIEIFGPFLQLIRVADFDEALREANRTRYGLAAALLSDNPRRYAAFERSIRAGIVNWNRPTTGASGRLPFGGVGRSGNHRPSGFFAADYCAYPVASVESERLALPHDLTPGIAR